MQPQHIGHGGVVGGLLWRKVLLQRKAAHAQLVVARPLMFGTDFLVNLLFAAKEPPRRLDGGLGVGLVTLHLLLPAFEFGVIRHCLQSRP